MIKKKHIFLDKLRCSIYTFCSYSLTASYNYVNQYSLMSYMEYPVIIVQELILIFCFLYYSNKLDAKSFSIFGIHAIIIVCICQDILPHKILDFAVVRISNSN